MSIPSTIPNILGNSSLSTFDTIVIGSGAGGATVARTLALAGHQVLVLEAGDNYFPSLDLPAELLAPQFANDEVKLRVRGLAQDSLLDPRSFRTSAAEGSRTRVGDIHATPRNVGGASVHASMLCPRFQPTDFQLGSLLGAIPGASFADWPVSYGTLERYYVEIEQLTGVQGPEASNADPFAPAKSKPYPMPPGLPMYANTILANAARRRGYHPFAYPAAIASRPYRGRPACIECGFCAGYGCPTHAKGSPAVTLLRDALLTDRVQLRFNAAVTRLTSNASRTAVTGVEYVAADGSRQTVAADRYVLAANAVESSRLLLLSEGIGNSSGLVGRNLMVHLQTTVLGVLRDRIHGHRGRGVTMGMSDFRGVPNDPTRPLGGIVELATSADLIGEAKHYARTLGKTGAVLKSLLQQSPMRDKLVALVMQGEDAPQPTNTVDLDPELKDVYGRPAARITYANHEFETKAREFYIPQMLEIVEEAGAQFSLVAPLDGAGSSRHVMGTLRMGTAPGSSVCDPVGKLHDLDNLWCADGALFPTSSGYNPTLTLQALALWVGANIASPGSPDAVLQESP